jgi:hypothetical protein
MVGDVHERRGAEMKTWKKVLIGGASALTLAGGANWAAMAAGPTNTPVVQDVKGPCDEAEHANDPQCAGPQVREDNGREDERGDDRGREQEARGREAESEVEHEAEDEAEHEARDDDRRGEDRGRDDRSGHDDGSSDDRSGHDDGSSDDRRGED